MFPIFSIIAGAGTALANGLATRRANKINQRNYQELKRYNSPAAQMGRFRAAGLNPNLIYTQSNEIDPAPAWQAPQFDFNSVASNATTELSSYQNIEESKARVSNINKQSKLLDNQITELVLKNIYQDKLNKTFDYNNRLNNRQIKAQIDNIYYGFRLIDKQCDSIANQIDINNKRFNLDDLNSSFNRLMQSKQFGLALRQFNLSQSQFTESVRQFNLTNQGKEYLQQFMKGLTDSESPELAGKYLGNLIRTYLLSDLSNKNRFDYQEDKINEARRKGQAYRRNGKWVRPWDKDY